MFVCLSMNNYSQTVIKSVKCTKHCLRKGRVPVTIYVLAILKWRIYVLTKLHFVAVWWKLVPTKIKQFSVLQRKCNVNNLYSDTNNSCIRTCIRGCVYCCFCCWCCFRYSTWLSRRRTRTCAFTCIGIGYRCCQNLGFRCRFHSSGCLSRCCRCFTCCSWLRCSVLCWCNPRCPACCLHFRCIGWLMAYSCWFLWRRCWFGCTCFSRWGRVCWCCDM